MVAWRAFALHCLVWIGLVDAVVLAGAFVCGPWVGLIILLGLAGWFLIVVGIDIARAGAPARKASRDGNDPA